MSLLETPNYLGVTDASPILELLFRRPLALRWEQESVVIIDVPQELPKCTAARSNNWTHPVLIIEESIWAEA